MPSSRSEYLFALVFALLITAGTGWIVVSDTQSTARERLERIETLKAERSEVQILAIKLWAGADQERLDLVAEVVKRRTRRSLSEFSDRRVNEEVEAVYRELLTRMSIE